MRPPVLVTGAPRSGTSLTAQVLEACGAWVGEIGSRRRGRHQPRGFYENLPLRNEIVMPMLEELTGDRVAETAWPETERLQPVEGFRERISTEIRRQGYAGGPWLYKDPKLCLLWPIWHAAFPKARWIVVRRDLDEVARSLAAAPFARAHGETETVWKRVAAEFLSRALGLAVSGPGCRILEPADLIAGRWDGWREAVRWAGLEWDAAAVEDCIRPRCWHGRAA